MKRHEIYREVKNAINDGYEPSNEFKRLSYNRMTKVFLQNELSLYKRTNEFKRFVGDDSKSFEVKIQQTDIKKQQKIISGYLDMLRQSDKKFIMKITFRNISSNVVDRKSYTVKNNQTLQLIESIFTDSDYDNYISDLNVVLSVEFIKLKKPRRLRNEGAFFNYYNPTSICLKKYGIYLGYEKSNYKVNCIIQAFISSGVLNKTEIKKLILITKTQYVPMVVIKKISDHFKININVRIRRKNNEDWDINKYGKKYDKKIDICLFKNHYFLDEMTNYTSYSIKNYHKLKFRENWNSYIEDDKKAKKGKKRIKSSKLIFLMDKNKLFKEIPYKDLKKTQFLGNYQSKIPNAVEQVDSKKEEYTEKLTTLTNVNGVWRKSKNDDVGEKKERPYVFADFESCTSGEKHTPFMCSYRKATLDADKNFVFEDVKNIVGRDCGIKFLDAVDDNSIIYFHNSGYDLNFIYEHTKGINIIKNGSFVYIYSCLYNGKKLQINDSYAMIPAKLGKFSEMFDMGSMKKEIMPYSLYKDENFNEPCPIDDVKKHIIKKEWKEFLKLADPYINDGVFDKIGYAKFYCDRDVEVLSNGYEIFRKNMISEFDLDPLAYLTISSFANDYLMKKGCFDGVYKLGGLVREFIQKTVRGGRCMTRKNEKQIVNEKLNDFDGVSLYPSAMYLFEGFAKGKPKMIKKFEPNKYSQYYIHIKITKVNKKLDFPLIGKLDENGVLQYVNEPTDMYVDKYTLEDLIKFQGIEYEFIDGYYFNKGFNTKIKETIFHMFNQRLKYKKDDNPIQILYKLLMNSSYGKTIIKEHLTDDVIINSDVYNGYVYRHHNYITNIKQTGRQYWITKTKAINDHFSYPQIGSSILSYSKRIMNRVFGVADDNDIPIYYQDTDSMHIKDVDVGRLEQLYDLEYSNDDGVPALVGKGLGQFHCDFELEGSKDPVSVKSIFLGKKTYLDMLEDRKDSSISCVHFRFKGIPGECVKVVANEMFSGNVYKLYEHLLSGNSIKFDLVKGIDRVRPVFENRHGVVKSLFKFVREVSL
jgi:hypothetical protein